MILPFRVNWTGVTFKVSGYQTFKTLTQRKIIFFSFSPAGAAIAVKRLSFQSVGLLLKFTSMNFL